MKKSTKLFIILASITMLTTLFAVSTFAEVYTGSCGAEGSNVTYTLDTETGVFELSGTGKMADYYQKTTPWYYYTNYIEELKIDNGVTNIGEMAFGNCNFKTINIPDHIETVGKWAFARCYSLTDITINASAIGQAAFAACNLLNIAILENVSYIEETAFSGNSNLAFITVENNEHFKVCDGILFDFNMTRLIKCPGTSTLFSYIVPQSVTSIDESAFVYCNNLTEIYISKNVINIGSYAFDECTNLRSVNIEGKINVISDYLFRNCEKLENVNIPESVTIIGDDAFYNCYSLKSITIPNSVERISDYAFYNCISLANLSIGENVSFIGVRAFYNCDSLELLELPFSMTRLEAQCFAGCYNLKYIYLPDGIKKISYEVFELYNLLSIYVIQGSYAEEWAYEKCSSKVDYLIRLDCINKQLEVGEKFSLTAFLPPTFSDEYVIWTTNNSDIARVENGIVNALSNGNATIKASLSNGYYAYCNICVVDAIETADDFMTFEGYQVRDTEYNGLRSRFIVDVTAMPTLEKDGLEVIEYGAIFASTDKLNASGDEFVVTKNDSGVYETLSYGRMITVMKNGKFVNKLISHDDEQVIFACTVTNFTENNYDKEISIRGYAVLSDADGNEYVVYCDYPSEDYRSVSLAMICDALVENGQITVENNISYAHVVKFRYYDDTEF